MIEPDIPEREARNLFWDFKKVSMPFSMSPQNLAVSTRRL
jgi:hypothetical protein